MTSSFIVSDCIDFLKAIPDSSVHAVITDPPYGICAEEWDVLHPNTNSALGGVSPAMQGTSFRRRGKPIAGWNNGDKNITRQYGDWCLSWMSEVFRICMEGSPVLVFNSRRMVHRLCCSMEDSGLVVRDLFAWRKRGEGRAQRINKVLEKRGMPRDDLKCYRLGNLRPDFEPIVWGMKPYPKLKFVCDCVVKNGVGGFMCEDGIRSNVFEYKHERGRYNRYQKPLELVRELVCLFTMPGQIVVDPFAGTGTTLVACRDEGRICLTADKNGEYASVIKSRIGASSDIFV